MFLNQLSIPLQKALFLELAMLVMMASHDDDASEQMAEYNSDAVLSKFLASISTKEAEMLEEYQKELFTGCNYNDNFIELSFADYIKGFDDDLDVQTWISGDVVYSSGENFPIFKVALRTVIDMVLAQYGNNPEVKQEVIQYLLANGEDILNLNPQKIQSCMASLPKIKQEILQHTVRAAFKPKQEMGLTLSEREKKIILCELIGAAYSSGAFEAEEKQLLESICQTLDIDSEYIEEFDDVMFKLFKVNQELAELINE